MKDAGELYYQRGIDFFESGQYENAVLDWIQAYEYGYKKEQILENLYGCFVEPNDGEYRTNYKQNSEGFTELAYEKCLVDFIPVSEERFYIFDRESGDFCGLIDLEEMPVRGKKETFDSILFIDIWDIREIIPDLQENNRDCVYLLLNDMECKFISFFKLPRFRELYCSNLIIFRGQRLMRTFFEEYDDIYLPKQFVSFGTQIDTYKEILQKIHQKRVSNVNAKRENVFLTICIPGKAEKEEILLLRSYLCQCFYDSEIEVLMASDRNDENIEDARVHYFIYDEKDSYALNVLKALDIAKGRYKLVIDAKEIRIWKHLGENLDYIKAHAKYTVFCIHNGKITENSELFTDLEWLQYFLPKIIREKQDLFKCLELKFQYTAGCFANGVRGNIAQDWEQAISLIEAMQQLLEIDKARIPVAERDDNLIVMTTTQLLSPEHAPTRILLEMSRILEVYLNKRVFLISEIKEYDVYSCIKAGLKNHYKLIYTKEFNGEFVYHYKECCFSGYQIRLKSENILEMKQLMQKLYTYKPYCVWCFGGIPAFAGVMKQFTSMIYTQFMEGYPGMPADMVVNYFEHASANYPQEKEFLTTRGVKVQEIRIGLPSYQKAKGLYQRSNIGISEDAFCIGIVGNRLERDCTDDFLNMLGQVLHNNKSNKIWLVFIGGASNEFAMKVAEKTKEIEHLRFLGYCEEFADAIALTDLVVATPGLGNGGTGVTALQEGIPVVSLKVGDIAACVGEDFQCESLEEYPALIQRYMEDSDFYAAQSKKAVEVFQSLLVEEEEVAQQVGEILEQVKGL